MKNILVPVDFSDCSKQAASVAYLLANKFGAKMHLFTSLELPRNWSEMDETERQQDDWAQETLQRGETKLSELKRWYADVPVETTCTDSDMVRNIAKYVQEKNIDLVVMGSHGASGKSEYFIGSNTQKVVRSVHCPVLVIKNPMERIDFRKVVFASNFNKDDLPVFKHFKNLIKHFVPEIHLVAIHTSLFDAPYPILKDAMKPFEETCRPLTCHSHVYQDLSIDEGVRSFSREIGADLIAVSNHERHPVKRMLIGSNVELLVNHSELPVLTIDY